ncbi:Pyroglutamyl peptidase [Musa troglodytarum]|uniref:Pyroglutamyl peptidase n=1 Tax=Musa troglodytarum TaxID=320322 RepID=A0A9E7K9A2_9LILI|nr:Pyroglutamyl peptidase [Musa troglodytarum]
MGSERSSEVAVHITGFGRFHGVPENPTEVIVGGLEHFMQEKGLPQGLRLGSCNVLETAGEGALAPLYRALESAVPQTSTNSGRVIWVHFGVGGNSPCFAVEKQAVNEASFLCPDELGWEPMEVPIIDSDGGISHVRQTTLPVDDIVKALAKTGYLARTSLDAGCFVCNYVYYHSLRFAEQHGFDSLFVHVPPFETINKESQMKFVACLLDVLASLP